MVTMKGMLVPDYTLTEMRVSLGFAVSVFVSFAVTLFAWDVMTWDRIEAVWTIAIAAGFINHGIWDSQRGMVLGGLFSILATLVSLAYAPLLLPVGWIILGCATAVSAFSRDPRTESLIGVYIALGGSVRLLTVYLSTSTLSSWMVWMVLVGLMIITTGLEGRNPVLRFLGSSIILASVITYTFSPEIMLFSVAMVSAVGMVTNVVYLYRLLGRAPKVGEVFSLACRALFLHGLKRPIDQYGILAILINGNIGAENIIHDLISHLQPKCVPIVLLGPTAPTQLSLPDKAKLGWITTVSSAPNQHYAILAPEDPSMVNVFLTKTIQTLPTDAKPVILGDFLDSMIPHMDKSLFYKYYSDLASTARTLNYTLAVVVKADIHGEVTVNIVKRFADVIIENREREERGGLVREIRVSNRVDNVNTNWERY
jgi:hypothetical protein